MSGFECVNQCIHFMLFFCRSVIISFTVPCSFYFYLPPPIFCNIYHYAIVISRCIFIITFCMVGPVNLLIFQRLFPTRYLITIISLAASDLPLRGLMVKKKRVSVCMNFPVRFISKISPRKETISLPFACSPTRPFVRLFVCLLVC